MTFSDSRCAGFRLGRQSAPTALSPSDGTWRRPDPPISAGTMARTRMTHAANNPTPSAPDNRRPAATSPTSIVHPFSGFRRTSRTKTITRRAADALAERTPANRIGNMLGDYKRRRLRPRPCEKNSVARCSGESTPLDHERTDGHSEISGRRSERWKASVDSQPQCSGPMTASPCGLRPDGARLSDAPRASASSTV